MIKTWQVGVALAATLGAAMTEHAISTVYWLVLLFFIQYNKVKKKRIKKK